jgi:hypothetical protein
MTGSGRLHDRSFAIVPLAHTLARLMRSADQAFSNRRLSRGAHDLVAHSDRSNSNPAHRGHQPAPRYSSSALLDQKLATPENDFIVK